MEGPDPLALREAKEILNFCEAFNSGSEEGTNL